METSGVTSPAVVYIHANVHTHKHLVCAYLKTDIKTSDIFEEMCRYECRYVLTCELLYMNLYAAGMATPGPSVLHHNSDVSVFSLSVIPATHETTLRVLCSSHQ